MYTRVLKRNKSACTIGLHALLVAPWLDKQSFSYFVANDAFHKSCRHLVQVIFVVACRFNVSMGCISYN